VGAIDTTGMMARSGAGVGIICGTDTATAVAAAACCWAMGGPGTWTVCACTARGNKMIKCRIQPTVQTVQTSDKIKTVKDKRWDNIIFTEHFFKYIFSVRRPVRLADDLPLFIIIIIIIIIRHAPLHSAILHAVLISYYIDFTLLYILLFFP